MVTPIAIVLKKVYRVLARFSAVERAREAFRSKVQLRYWPWYRLPPRRPGSDPDFIVDAFLPGAGEPQHVTGRLPQLGWTRQASPVAK